MSAAVRNLASLGAPARATTAPRRAPRVVASAAPAEKNDVAPRRCAPSSRSDPPASRSPPRFVLVLVLVLVPSHAADTNE